mmetsp:Transcript_44184/g.116109  ORF Transcript_44184/g.116109 Transcript_44184/m.116109 type:complete len:158 (+) Transcript_44184:62-535(+)
MLAAFLHAALSLPIPGNSSSIATSSSWVLALQRCDGSPIYTLHGLWPPSNDCSGPAFSEAAISSIESQMKQYWPSCAEYGMTNVDFWDHEWSKHGTCSGLDEKSFFSAALSLRSKYVSYCGALNAEACSLSCSGPSGPCSLSYDLVESEVHGSEQAR